MRVKKRGGCSQNNECQGSEFDWGKIGIHQYIFILSISSFFQKCIGFLEPYFQSHASDSSIFVHQIYLGHLIPFPQNMQKSVCYSFGTYFSPPRFLRQSYMAISGTRRVPSTDFSVALMVTNFIVPDPAPNMQLALLHLGFTWSLESLGMVPQ